jgi:hypothetical protein
VDCEVVQVGGRLLSKCVVRRDRPFVTQAYAGTNIYCVKESMTSGLEEHANMTKSGVLKSMLDFLSFKTPQCP